MEEAALRFSPGHRRVRRPRDDDPGSAGESRHVYVDITAYNSKIYYVDGAVSAPGRLPWTGAETVLDAIYCAGGLAADADMANIWIVRPSRGGKAEQIHMVDLQTILDGGDIQSNYQLFRAIGWSSVSRPMRLPRDAERP